MSPSRLLRILIFAAAVLFSFSANQMSGAETRNLRVGVAKTDITPEDLSGLTNLWKRPFEGVHDRIYLRALVVDNGINTAAIVSADLVEFGDTMALRQQIVKELGIPANHVILTASHNHNAPRVGTVTAGASAQVGGPATAAYTERVYSQIIDVLRQAKAAMQPARVGIGTGRSTSTSTATSTLPVAGSWGTIPTVPPTKPFGSSGLKTRRASRSHS